MFQASTWFTEKVSAGKYPEYREYQARVGRFLPRLSTEAVDWSGGKDGAGEGDEGRKVTRSMAKEK